MDDLKNDAPAPAMDQNKLMAILAYIGPLVIISFLAAKDDVFVKFHIKQGLVLFVIEIAVAVIASMVWVLFPVLQVVNIAATILAILGIINAAKGKEKELPLVGKFSKYFTF